MFEKGKRKIYIIIPIVLLVVIGVVVLVVMLTKKDDSIPENSTDVTEEEDNTLAEMPAYDLFGSKEALSLMKEKALQWASDTKFLSCSGSVRQYEENDTILYLGSENGEYPSWSCFIYSPTNKQDTVVQVYKDSTTLLEAHTQWGMSEYEENPDARPMYNVDSFIDSSTIYDSLISTGYDPSINYITFNFGLSDGIGIYGDRAVWQINEYSRTELEDPTDEYSQGKLLNIYYYDAISGEKL